MQFGEYLGNWIFGNGRTAILLSAFGTGGNGLCVMLTGGELAHIGGVAYAAPRNKSNADGITADISTVCGSGHKDVYAAAIAAKKICVSLGETICVTAGIHVDNATPEELERINKNVEAVTDAFIVSYQSK